LKEYIGNSFDVSYNYRIIEAIKGKNNMEEAENRVERIARNIVDKEECDVLGWVEFFPDYDVASKSEINKIAAHLDVVDFTSKNIISERSWDLFELMYEYIGGFHSYESPREMAQSAHYIKAVYDGKLDNIKDFQIEKCYAIATFNLKFGLKMTALVANVACLDKIKVRAAVKKLQQTCLKIGWLECSGKAERFVMSCGGGRCIIDPQIIKNVVYKDRQVEIDKDGKHYTRVLSGNGQAVRKLAVGKISI